MTDRYSVTRRPSSLTAFGKRLRRWWQGLARWWQAWRAGAATTGEPVALAALQSATPRCRWEAAVILGRNPQRSREAIAALVRALGDPEAFVRWQAAEALAAQEAANVFPVLAATLDDPEPLRRAGAAEALGRLGGEAAALILGQHVGDPDPGVRAALATALGQTCDLTSLSLLVGLLTDVGPDVRRAAARALGRLGDPKAAAALATLLAPDAQPLLVRRAAAAAIAAVPHPDARPQLLAALADPDPQVRGYAAQALGHIGDETASGALTALQTDQSRLLHGTVGDRARRALTMLERRGRRLPGVGRFMESR